jgi:D-alanine-D-alanine ligase
MKIGVIMGGTSSEREISILTGNEIIKNLDTDRYEVIKIEINTRKELIEKVQENSIDFALLALHGKFGEDGGAQAILESLGIPYSGCGVVSSMLCMDKGISKKLMKAEKINTPNWTCIKKHQEINYNSLKEMGYPLIVKPVNGGSSLGTVLINNEEEVMDGVLKALDFDEEVIIEKYISGIEITCSILEKKLLPVLCIKPKSSFFDYRAKYQWNEAEEVVIELDNELKYKLEALCMQCWDLFKCEVYARIDVIISENTPYVLEVNTLPGMTENSLFPKSAKAAGMEFRELLDTIIASSLKIKR